jgi:23S rRNA (uracil1939-C5)-methyltransferase
LYKKNTELTLEISALSSEGKGIAKVEEQFVVFVEHALPGDKVLANITRKKSNYAEARIIEILSPSPWRVKPDCEHFGVCGGCKLQNLDYEKQIEYKTDNVKNALRRIGGFTDVDIPLAIKCDSPFYYRNKMEFSFSDDKWLEVADKEKPRENFALGLHVPKFHSKIIDINKCFLQSEISNGILNFTRNYFKTKNISIYSTHTHSGFLRFLIIRQSMNVNALMVNIMTYAFDKDLIEKYARLLIAEFPQITTVVNSTTDSKAQVAFAQKTHTLFGSGFITEKLFPENYSGFNPEFKISPNSFFQTNTNQIGKLYSAAAEFAELKKEDNVLDLYCGAGTIAIYISDKVNKVLGVELIPDAIENANENLGLNKTRNVSFVTSDIKDFLSGNKYGDFNKVILDPPRSGLHPDICEVLSVSHFEKIIYVSCNPGTQSRDLKLICGKENFKVDNVQPVDMFPQTYHIENVVSLIRKEK